MITKGLLEYIAKRFLLHLIIVVSAISVLSKEDSTLPESDIELLSKLITSECGICPTEEKYLVGSVVLNRLEDDKFPNSVEGVISQNRQFDGYLTNQFVRSLESDKVAKNLALGENKTPHIFYFVREDLSNNKKFINFIKSGPFIKAKYHTFKIGL